MTSKKPKGELMAICKLEFYRKQKSWRHCPQERSKGKDAKKRTKSTNAKLNQTYNIVPAPKKEEPSVPEIQENEEQHILDEAFVDTETGTESDEPLHCEDRGVNAHETEADISSSQLDPPGSPYSPKWSIQRWAERRRLWKPEPTSPHDPTCPTYASTRPSHNAIIPTHDPPCPTYASTRPTLDTFSPTPVPTCPTYASTRPTLDPTCPIHDPTLAQENANCPIFDNNHNKIRQDVYYSSHYLSLHHKEAAYDSNYPIQSNDPKCAHEPLDPKYGVTTFYYNSKMYHHEFDVPQSGQVCEWQVHDWERCAGEGAVWSDLDWLQEAAAMGAGGEDAVDGAWQLHDLSDASCDSLPSVASSEFIRGATLAPHSTQIDLLVGAEPARLAPAALAAAVAEHSAAAAGHAAALRALLAEAQRRQMPKEVPQPLSEVYSFDEVPVRDPGPAELRPPAARFNDPILAGSRPAPDLRGHTGTAGHIGTAGHTGAAEQTGQTEDGRGRGRLKVGIRMGRPYRL